MVSRVTTHGPASDDPAPPTSRVGDVVDDVRGPRLQPGPTPAKRLELDRLLDDGVVHGDALDLLPQLDPQSVALFFTSPPYADQRAYSRIHPDRYVEWFLPFAR